jgi:hypothetical protein
MIEKLSNANPMIFVFKYRFFPGTPLSVGVGWSASSRLRERYWECMLRDKDQMIGRMPQDSYDTPECLSSEDIAERSMW